MKRLNVILIAAFVAASAMLVSCGEDTEEDNPQVKIVASYMGANGSPASVTKVNEDFEITGPQGSLVTLNITYSPGANKLANVNLRATGGAWTNAVLLDSTLNTGMFSGKEDIVLPPFTTSIGSDDIVLTLGATDNKNTPRATEVKITIKQEEPEAVAGDPEDEFEYFVNAVYTEFGAQRHATAPSFYNVANATAMNLGTARQNASFIDFVFYYHDVAGASVGCTADNETTTTFGYNIASLTPKRTTNFYKLENHYTSAANIKDAWWNAGAEELGNDTKANGLKVNDVVFFKVGNSIGAFIVEQAPANNAGTFRVKFIERK